MSFIMKTESRHNLKIRCSYLLARPATLTQDCFSLALQPVLCISSFPMMMRLVMSVILLPGVKVSCCPVSLGASGLS